MFLFLTFYTTMSPLKNSVKKLKSELRLILNILDRNDYTHNALSLFFPWIQGCTTMLHGTIYHRIDNESPSQSEIERE